VITAAGVSAGIDMALYVASLIADEEEAKAIQLAIEYDPHPPFTAGSLQQASPATIARAKHRLQSEALSEVGSQLRESILRPFLPQEDWSENAE